MDIEKVALETPEKISTNKIDLKQEGPSKKEVENIISIFNLNTEQKITASNLVITLYKILTYGQSRVDQAKRLGDEGVQLYNEKKYSEAFVKFQEANNLDPIDPVYALNAGFSMYESKQYDKAISFFNLVIPTRHNNDNVLRAMRYKALSLITLNRRQEACQVFDKLRVKGRKRMYNQEYQKYCK